MKLPKFRFQTGTYPKRLDFPIFHRNGSKNSFYLGIWVIDTAPIIYYIEAHPDFGPFAKEVVDSFQSGILVAYSSVITLAEVLPKPIQMGREELARKFAEFLRKARNFGLIEISVNIAEKAGRLRGKYPTLRALDAIQLSTALDVKADAFLTNDNKLKSIKELKVLVLKDYLSSEKKERWARR